MTNPANLDFGPAVGLVCRECGTLVDLGPRHVCAECFGPLEVKYEFGKVTREQIEAGPRSIWRYAPLLPVPQDAANRPADLAPGFTKLQESVNLAKRLGLKKLWIKDDRDNPTHSFKDRVVGVAMTAGKTLGFTTISCASTGNLANAVAAAAARAGMRSVVLIPDNLELGKVLTSAVYGTTLVGIHGNYDDVNRLCSEIADDRGYGFVNVNLRPYYAEGSKTLGYEIAEQLKDADLVIGSVLIPGEKAPKLVTDAMVAKMKPGSVLVDIAIDQGGCFENSKPTTHDNPTYKVHNSTYYCVANMPGAVPATSTRALTNATLPYVIALAEKGWKTALQADAALALGLNTHEGYVTYAGVQHAFADVPFKSLAEVLA